MCPWENRSMLSAMAHRPVKWFRNFPVSFWNDNGYRVFVILCRHRFRYKVRCSKCKCTCSGEAYTMKGVEEWIKRKPCHH